MSSWSRVQQLQEMPTLGRSYEKQLFMLQANPTPFLCKAEVHGMSGKEIVAIASECVVMPETSSFAPLSRSDWH